MSRILPGKTNKTDREESWNRLNGVKQFLNKVLYKNPNAEADFMKYASTMPLPPYLGILQQFN